MDIAGVSSLLRAVTDLKVARAIRGPAGLPCQLPVHPTPAILPRRVEHPEPRIEPREVIHPDPLIEPRRIIHPTPIVEPRPVQQASQALELPSPDPAPAEPVHKSTSPIEPPWALLPWKQPPEIHLPERVKIVLRLPDSPVKGRILDLFV